MNLNSITYFNQNPSYLLHSINKGLQSLVDTKIKMVACTILTCVLLIAAYCAKKKFTKDKVFQSVIPPKGNLNFPVGIPNFGNSCYLATAIQALMLIPELRETIRKAGEKIGIYGDLYTAYTERQKNNPEWSGNKYQEVYQRLDAHLREAAASTGAHYPQKGAQGHPPNILKFIFHNLRELECSNDLEIPLKAEFELTEEGSKAANRQIEIRGASKYNPFKSYFEVIYFLEHTYQGSKSITTRIKDEIQSSHRTAQCDHLKKTSSKNDENEAKFFNHWWSLEEGVLVKQFTKPPEYLTIQVMEKDALHKKFEPRPYVDALEIVLESDQVKTGESAKYECVFYFVNRPGHWHCHVKIDGTWYAVSDNTIAPISLKEAREEARSSIFLHFIKQAASPL